MTKKVWSWRQAIQEAELKSLTKLVLYNLSIHMNDRGESCFPSITTQARDTGVSERGIYTALAEAEKSGLILKEKAFYQGKVHNTYKALFPTEKTTPAPDAPMYDVQVTPAPYAGVPLQEVHPNSPSITLQLTKERESTANKVMGIWNRELEGKLPSVKQLTDTRRQVIKSRLKEFFSNDIGLWEQFCRKICDSPFLFGNNDRSWKANFDWCMEPKNLIKILEGNYENSSELGRNTGKHGNDGQSQGNRTSAIDEQTNAFIGRLRAKAASASTGRGLGREGTGGKDLGLLLENTAPVRQET